MSSLRFEWDPAKAALNLTKHGVSFDEARTVFEDEEALFMADPDHSTEEDRWVLLGMSGVARVLVVVHCERAAGTVVRLISARKADREERDLYAARRP